jgi:hypothetical protein
MDMDQFRSDFSKGIQNQLAAISRTMNVFDQLVTDVGKQLKELAENAAELKRLTMEQGVELRALRERLDGTR